MPSDNHWRDPGENTVERRDLLKMMAGAAAIGSIGVASTGTAGAQSSSGPPFKMPNNDTFGFTSDKAFGVHPAALAFDTQNRPYMLNIEGTTGDTVGHILAYRDGGWVELDYTSALDDAGVDYDLDREDNRERAWLTIDEDDDIYALHQTIATSSGGLNPFVLLYTSDFGQSWQVWEIDNRSLLEVDNGNNDLSVPPLIGFFSLSNDTVDVYVPEKNDGVLDLGDPIRITDDALGYSTHSGGHQWAITNNENEAFIAYARNSGRSGTNERDDNPHYVARIDRQSKTVTDRVFIDESTESGTNRHASPAMVKDYDGYIHYIVGTQGDNFKYYRSENPGTITDGWTDYELTGSSKSTYASLICDDQNRLHNLWHKDRWDPGDVYQRKDGIGSAWTSGELFLEPPDDYNTGDYEAYYHRGFVDRDGGAIYYSYQFYHRGISDEDNNYPRQLVVSTDGGQNWSPATTSGFSDRVFDGGGGEQSPYGGDPWPIPGKIEAEDYDEGSQDVAYTDTTSGNEGGHYRSDDVDIGEITTGEYHVGWIADGEWIEFTCDVESSGRYDLDLRAASNSSGGGSMHVEVDGTDVTGLIDTPYTDGWQNYTTVTVEDVDLTAGERVVRLYFDEGSFNIDWMEWTKQDHDQSPYGGEAWSIPGRIEAEDFDEGGQDVAYWDSDSGNNGSSTYRSTDVDLSEFSTGEHHISYIEPDEWVEYTCDIQSSGTYDLDLRVARKPSGSKTMHVEVDGTDVTGPIDVPSTGGWYTHTTITVEGVDLTAGESLVHFYFDEGSFNVDWMEWADADGGSGDLEVHYKFDESSGASTASDSSGNGRDATINSGVTTGVSGKDGTAFDFDGSSTATVVESGADAYINGLDEITVSAWVKSDTTNNDNGIFNCVDDGGDNGDGDVGLRYDKDGWEGGGTDLLKAGVSYEDSDGNVDSANVETESNLQTTDWQHVAYVWEAGDQPRIYVDGSEVNYETTASTPSDATIADQTVFAVGEAVHSSTWDGKIDDVRVYSRRLSDGELADLASTDSTDEEFEVEVDGSTETFTENDFTLYSDQDAGSIDIVDGGDGINLTGNAWRKIPLQHTITADTVIEVELEAPDYGEIYGIGFDDDNDHWNEMDDSRTLFHLEGEQTPGDHIDATGEWTLPGPETVTLDVGQHYTGTSEYLCFVADDDNDASADVYFRNVRVYAAN